MGMGFAPTWLRQVSPQLHMTTLTTGLGLWLGWRQVISHVTVTFCGIMIGVE